MGNLNFTQQSHETLLNFVSASLVKLQQPFSEPYRLDSCWLASQTLFYNWLVSGTDEDSSFDFPDGSFVRYHEGDMWLMNLDSRARRVLEVYHEYGKEPVFNVRGTFPVSSETERQVMLQKCKKLAYEIHCSVFGGVLSWKFSTVLLVLSVLHAQFGSLDQTEITSKAHSNFVVEELTGVKTVLDLVARMVSSPDDGAHWEVFLRLWTTSSQELLNMPSYWDAALQASN